jgi:O-antigen ligase
MVGWGMWNNIGGMLAMLLPIHFYFAATVKKLGAAFYISGAISFLAIVLTLSRSSLLVSCLIIVISAIACCFFGNNKKICRIITGAIFAIGVLGIILLWNKISSILGDYLSRGLDDNGRFDIYKKGFENFLQNPIFGGGFYSVDAQEHTFAFFLPDRYHNTIIQMLGACGIVGLLAYAFHRYQVVRLFWLKRSLYTFFAFLSICALLLTSLLDNHFFNFYPTFIYSIILAIISNTEKELSN